MSTIGQSATRDLRFETKMVFKVLKSCRRILSITNLLEKRYIHIGRFKIATIFLQFAYMIPMNFSLALILCFCMNQEFNLKKTSGAIGISLGIIQMDLIFICFSYQKPLTTKILTDFQSIVSARKCCINSKEKFQIKFVFFHSFQD